jgi:hypothetical protein
LLQTGTPPLEKGERLLQTVERLSQRCKRFAEAQNRNRAEVAFSMSRIDNQVENLQPKLFALKHDAPMALRSSLAISTLNA